jgi:transcriptional regulator with XRE-family HTH domain
MVFPMPSTSTPENPWVPVIDGDELRKARELRDLTQRDVIEACGRLGTKVDKGNYHRAERGLPGAIGIRKLRVVAAVLGVGDIGTLLTGRGRADYGYRVAA